MKQVIVVNSALDLPPGKLAAQVAHASVSAYLEADPEIQQDWIGDGMPKIVLSAPSPEALQEIFALAEGRGIAASLVRDAGKTVIPAGTITALGLGPDEAHDIDRLTGALPLV
ncbi:aminoacyl-tRNA hydrolase [Nitratireductor sp. XY-223]|uniref:aminoacyl-tRNA hydrolase n=1 Tax=Nitratireductor sp. XY-223 TaxID=2561926 RepID=UPI0010A9ECE9|nr:aminoacyl-tRNA hydrolase [Nitratireductor sp. XY-223]